MAKSSIIYNQSLNSLVQKLLKQMEDAGYSKQTLTSIFILLRPIQTFMDLRGVAHYSKQIGINYLNEYFKSHKQSKRWEQTLVRTIKLLNDSCDGKFITRQKAGFFYNESLSYLISKLTTQLKSLGFSKETIKNYITRLRPIQTYMKANKIIEYTDKVGVMYYQNFLKTHITNDVTKKELKASISRLNDIYNEVSFIRMHTSASKKTIIPQCFEKDVSAFMNYISFYGNSKKTIYRRTKALNNFLTKCLQSSVHSVSELTPKVIQLTCKNVTNIDDWVTIRQFLKYLAIHNKTSSDFSIFVPQKRREKKVPTTYSIEEIKSIESNIDKTTFQGKRDYVIILMASRLAIRSGDIAKMKISNLDFTTATISFIQQKTDTEIKLPMIPELKIALDEYLSEADTSDGYLFHTLFAPYNHIDNNVVNNTVNRYINKAKINIVGKRHGPHALRASVTTSMINDDIPYEAVRSILGHSSPNSIKYYAKNDIEKLRRCSIDVPAPKRNFAIFLTGGVTL